MSTSTQKISYTLLRLANQKAQRHTNGNKMETRRWILLAVIILAPAEGTNLEEGLTEGTNILSQLFGGQDDCDGGYKCPNGEYRVICS